MAKQTTKAAATKKAKAPVKKASPKKAPSKKESGNLKTTKERFDISTVPGFGYVKRKED